MRTLLYISLLGLTACNFQPVCSGYDSYHQSKQVILEVHNSYPIEYINTLHMAMDTWNAAVGYNLFLMGGRTNILPRKEGRNTLAFLQVWDELSGTQGMTYLNFTARTIIDADVIISPKYKFSIDGNKADPTQINLQALLTHELGHVLGMLHERGTMMNPTLGYGENRTVLTSRDIDRLHCYY